MSEFLPFSRPALDVDGAELAAVSEILQSSRITTDLKCTQLEQAFCQLTSNVHAIAMSSASGGTHVTLMALGLQPDDEVIAPGYKYNLVDINVAIALVQLHNLSQHNAGRGTIAQRYRSELADTPLPPRALPTWEHHHAWHLFIIRVDERQYGIDSGRLDASAKKPRHWDRLAFSRRSYAALLSEAFSQPGSASHRLELRANLFTPTFPLHAQ